MPARSPLRPAASSAVVVPPTTTDIMKQMPPAVCGHCTGYTNVSAWLKDSRDEPSLSVNSLPAIGFPMATDLSGRSWIALRKSNPTNLEYSKPINITARAPTSKVRSYTLGKSVVTKRDSMRVSPRTKTLNSVRLLDRELANNSTHRQSSTNSPHQSTRESSTGTRRPRNTGKHPQTPTHQATISKYPTSATARTYPSIQRFRTISTSRPQLPARLMATTRSQAIANAQRIMATRQNPQLQSSTRSQPIGVGTTAAETARQAEAEKVRIQEYAARMTAQNNPPRPYQGLRKEMIAQIKAATNRRLDTQEYAARMATEAEAARVAKEGEATRLSRETEAATVVARLDRVQEDVHGIAPHMAEATGEMISAARILMQLKLEQIASMECTIQETNNRVAHYQAAQNLAAVNQDAQQAAWQRAAGHQGAQQLAWNRAVLNQGVQQSAWHQAALNEAAQQAAHERATRYQATYQTADEAEEDAMRLLYMRHGFNFRHEQERLERERERNAQK